MGSKNNSKSSKKKLTKKEKKARNHLTLVKSKNTKAEVPVDKNNKKAA
ncbi:MAG: hypothetical protein ISR65_09350 [Bacteriovoracaceae bacterium]|nr:hypothetical protein [Bacteriovoracaceae bacterium]